MQSSANRTLSQINSLHNSKFRMNNRLKIFCFFLLIFAGVSLRLICRDLPNFAPVGALALFAGFMFRSYLIAAMVPIGVVTISNIQLGGYENNLVMFSVYACFVLPTLFGRWFLKNGKGDLSVLRVFAFSLSGALLFFFVTNYTSYLHWYPQTAEGFIECYVAAIPFFRYTLAGDLFFTCVFFGGYALATRLSMTTQVNKVAIEGDHQFE